MRSSLQERIQREAYFINQRTGWNADKCWHVAEKRVLARSNRTRNGNLTRTKRKQFSPDTDRCSQIYAQMAIKGWPHAH